MARGGSDDEHPYGLNEVDDFAQKRGEILLNQSTLNKKQHSYDSDEELADNGEEEIMGIDESDEDDNEGDASDYEVKTEDVHRKVFGRRMEPTQNSDDEDLEGEEDDEDLQWGTTKNEYYGADDLDDDDEAKEIEKEALRQQKLHLEELHMQDFLDDEVENEWVKKAKDYDMEKFKESTSMKSTDASTDDIKNIFQMDEEAKKDFIKTSFPEFFPLAGEFTKLNGKLEELNAKADAQDSHILNIKKSALNAYISVIASYFALFLNELKNNIDEFHTMKDHPVMESILTLKEIWRQADELPDELELPEEDMNLEDGQEIDQEQSDAELEEVSEMDENILAATVPIDSEGESSGDDEGSENDVEDEEEQQQTDFGIDISASRVSKNENKKAREVDNDFLETDINDVDAAEKKARKKTLRFYTSKIDQADLKKLERFKGDDDIPYKERLFERQQRLLEEARKRGQKTGKDEEHDLDAHDYNSDDENVASSVNADGQTNDYYSQVKNSKLNKKLARTKAHEEAVIAAKEGKLAEAAENIGEDGKRAINYQILKNKGLTPKRHKDNRNSRVKKRKKYEKAQKKLKSVRQVYSGGQSGAYEGEKTGIKKNLVKSVKFKN
ncbi:hypothetical protein ACO0QE_004314 [Hanseniaspora vineae]